jgi:hypothetical protein
MDALVAAPNVVPVADTRRPRIGRAVRATFAAAGLFEVFVLGVKELRPLGDHAPWMDDPYDVVTSFAVFFVPLVGGLSAVRLALCRRAEPLPVARLWDLLHGCAVLLAIMLATVSSDWIAVLLGSDRAAWSSVTPALVAGLAGVTVVAALAAAALLAVGRRLPSSRRSTAGEIDWLADATLLASRLSRRLGPLEPVGSALIRAVERHVWAWIRRHPVTAAAAAAMGFAAVFDVGSLREGYSLPLLGFVWLVAWCGMFVLLVVSGSYIGLVRAPVALRGRRRRLLDAVLAGSASVPVALAFRDSLWWLVGTSVERSSLGDLDRLLGLTALAIAGATFVVETLGGVRDDPRPTP